MKTTKLLESCFVILIISMLGAHCAMAGDPDYVLKRVTPQKMLATKVAAGESYSDAYRKLTEYINEHPGLTADGPHTDLASDKENWAAVPVTGSIALDDEIEEIDLPSATVASTVYRGKSSGLRKAVSTLASELMAEGHELDIKRKSLRFVHLEASSSTEMATEIQIPLREKREK